MRDIKSVKGTIGFVVCLLVTGFLTACSTGYAPTNATGGYSVFPENRLTYRISLEANRFTTLNQAEEMILLKAAELTIKAGFERFVITKNNLRTKSVGNITPEPFKPLMAFSPGGSRPSGSVTIRILEPDDKAFPTGLDARKIYRHLKSKVDHQGPRF